MRSPFLAGFLKDLSGALGFRAVVVFYREDFKKDLCGGEGFDGILQEL